MKKIGSRKLATVIALGLVLSVCGSKAWAAETYGIHATGNQCVKVTGKQAALNVSAKGNACGILVTGAGSQVLATDYTAMTVKGGTGKNIMARGIIAEQGGTANVAMKGSLIVDGHTGTGNKGSVDAICADGAGSEITITGLTDIVGKSQQDTSAIGALHGAKVKVQAKGAINVIAVEGFAAAVYGQYAGSETTVTGITNIKVTGGKSAAGVESTDRGTTVVKLRGDVRVSSGGAADAIIAGKFFNKKRKDDPSTTTLIGLGKKPSVISALGRTHTALLFLDNGGTINIENIKGTETLAGNTGFAIAAAEEGGTVNMTKSSLTGNVGYNADAAVAGKTNVLNINIDSASSLQGAVRVTNNDSSKGAVINISNGGTWKITDTSTLNTLQNNGKVVFAPHSSFTELKVQSVVGSGIYVINTNLAKQAGDTIAIDTGNNSVVNIKVANDPVYATQNWQSVARGSHKILTLQNGRLEVKGVPTDIGKYRVTPNIVKNSNNSWSINGVKRVKVPQK